MRIGRQPAEPIDRLNPGERQGHLAHLFDCRWPIRPLQPRLPALRRGQRFLDSFHRMPVVQARPAGNGTATGFFDPQASAPVAARLRGARFIAWVSAGKRVDRHSCWHCRREGALYCPDSRARLRHCASREGASGHRGTVAILVKKSIRPALAGRRPMIRWTATFGAQHPSLDHKHVPRWLRHHRTRSDATTRNSSSLTSVRIPGLRVSAQCFNHNRGAGAVFRHSSQILRGGWLPRFFPSSISQPQGLILSRAHPPPPDWQVHHSCGDDRFITKRSANLW